MQYLNEVNFCQNKRNNNTPSSCGPENGKILENYYICCQVLEHLKIFMSYIHYANFWLGTKITPLLE